MTAFDGAEDGSRDQADITTPLLRKSTDSTSTSSSLAPSQVFPLHRTVEDDVLPETAVVGRTLHWSSAFIIIISRVIGSGIFATPGAITSSVGSIGLSLTLWVVGAAISWCGLAVGLEYGCMLPRSGGSIAVVVQSTKGTRADEKEQETKCTWNSHTAGRGFSHRP